MEANTHSSAGAFCHKKKNTGCYNNTWKHFKCYRCAFSYSLLTHCGQLSLPYQNVSVTAGRDSGTADSCCKRVCICLHLHPSSWAVFAAPLGFCINMLGSLRREQECMQFFHTLFFLRTVLSTCDRERGLALLHSMIKLMLNVFSIIAHFKHHNFFILNIA